MVGTRTSYRLVMASGSDPAGPQFYRYAIPENIENYYFMKFLTACRGTYAMNTERIFEIDFWHIQSPIEYKEGIESNFGFDRKSAHTV